MLQYSVKADTPPWETWKLDKNLADYNAKHPESTLDRVLDSVKYGLENHQPLFILIPDSPFPARGLIGALAHLIKLGITVHRAQACVREFADQVVAWVIDVKSAFSSNASGHFTWTTWKNLQKMRDLVEEICLWASARLTDRRWNRIGNGIMIANEIEEFNARINEAKGLFIDLTLINLSGGLDAIIGGLWILLQRQDTITKEIERIRDEQRRQFTIIIDAMEAQRQTEARRLFLNQNLSPRVVTNPMYDQQGKLPCDEDTRTQVLEDIRIWINDMSPDSPNFLWLTGDPGCGKSAITASVARECKDRNVLWAQYFINRNNIETTDPNSYFPSIARQFADHSTDVEVSIHDSLKLKPSLMDRISPEQAVELFVDAIGVASKLYPDRPVVVVIDGLDETDRTRLKDTATIFAQLFQHLAPHRNAKVVVSSRTEDDIRNPFARNMDDMHVKHIHLDIAAQSSIDDVSAFLRRKMASIVEENDLNWEEWPGEKRMESLTTRASGLFIWAVTTAKFIQEQIDTMGTECLNDVLDMLDTGALGDINTLYSIILLQTYKSPSNAWEFEKFRRIVGAIVVLCEPLCLNELGTLLDLRQTASSSPVDLIHFVRRLRTVLVAGTEEINETTIPRLHKSFYEFITSPHAQNQFHIDLEQANGELAVCCLTMLRNAHTTVLYGNSWTDILLPTPLRYALRFWSIHLQKAKGGTTSGVLIKTNPSLTPETCHKLLQNSGNNRRPVPLHIEFTRNQSQIIASSTEGRRTWDILTGLEIKAAHTILHGHKDFVSSVAFSADGKHLVSASADKTAIVWSLQSGQAIASLKGHSRAIHSIKYSPDGRYVATASSDFTVRVWDTTTYLPIAIQSGHKGPVRSIAFSSDGRKIVSGSDDRHLQFWEWGQHSSGRMALRHSRPVTSVTYAPGAEVVASSSEDATIQFWDSVKCQPLREESLRLSRPFDLQYSPNATYLAAIDGESSNIIDLWKPESHRPEAVIFGKDLVPPVQRICSVTFTPDETCLVLGCDDHSVRIVDIFSEERRSLRCVGHTGWVMAVAVSPDGKHIASGAVDNEIRIWDMPVVRDEARDGNADSATACTVLSSDGALILSSSSPQRIRLWDTRNSVFHDLLLPTSWSTEAQTHHLCFSSDRRRLAGVFQLDVVTIFVCDVDTGSLVASAVCDSASDISQLYFSVDGQYLLSSYDARRFDVWEERGGALVSIQDPQTPDPAVTAPMFFDISSTHKFDLNMANWYPSMSSCGLWGFLDDCAVRSHEDGSLTVLRYI
ncbi:hypothetical protein H0H92_013469 [Tricholoma furcatifolium]|nr:hypothetical protein H0H92_013469 [Tricholoma furcatifolium]